MSRIYGKGHPTPFFLRVRPVTFPGMLRSFIFPLIWVSLLLCCGYMIALLAPSLGGGAALAIANTFGPMVLILVTAGVAFLTVRRHPITIWTPYVAYLGQTALFFGLGPLVYAFGSATTLARLESSPLAISNVELARTNLLVSLGVMSALVGFLIAGVICKGERRNRSNWTHGSISLPLLAVVFVVTGALLRYGLVLPYEFGMTRFILPGFLQSMSHLLAIGLALMGYLAVKKKGVWIMMFWLLVLPNVFVAVLEFSKMVVIVNLLAPALGCYLAHRSVLRLTIWVLAGSILFVWMQPLVSYGRGEILSATGELSQATLPERFDLLHDYVRGEGRNRPVRREGGQIAWTRLAYSGPQAYAMELYDQGRSGNTLSDAWMIAIPRFIWPNKPVGVGPGQEFYEIVTGRRGSFLGLSVYGDGYWQGGWYGTVGVGIFMGLLFGWLSHNSLSWLGSGRLIYLPVIFLALQIAMLGPTKYIINGLIAPMPIYVAYILAIVGFLKFRLHWWRRMSMGGRFEVRGNWAWRRI